MDILPIATKTKRTSNALLTSIRRRSSLNRMYERQTLDLLKKSIEERKKTYDALSKRDREGKGVLGKIVGGSLILRRLRGRFSGGGRFRGGGLGGGLMKPKAPIRPKGGGTVGGGVGRFGRFGRIGPLAILGTGLDFAGRKAAGQTNLQAGMGAGGGLAGALGGAKLGAALGTAILPGVGTVIGGIGGSIIGGLAGGNIADMLTGRSDVRRRKEIQKLSVGSKTQFGRSLDKFDNVINTYEGSTNPILKDYKETGGAGRLARNPVVRAINKIAKKPFVPPLVGAVIGTIVTELMITAALALAPVPGTRFVAVGRLLKKLPLLGRIGSFIARRGRPVIAPAIRTVKEGASKVGEFTLRKAPKTSLLARSMPKARMTAIQNFQKSTLSTRMTNAVNRGNFPGQSITGRGKLELGRTMKDNRSFAKLDGLLDSIRKNKPIKGRYKKKFIENQPLNQKTRTLPNTKATNEALKNYKGGDDLLRKVESDKDALAGAKSLVERQTQSIIRGETKTPSGQDLFTEVVGKPNPSLKESIQRAAESNPDLFQEEGGRVQAGTPYIVGEVGKELFVPDVSGDIIPNNELGPQVIAMTSDPDTVIKPLGGGGGGSGGSSPPLRANPYAVVTKYAQMTGLFTV